MTLTQKKVVYCSFFLFLTLVLFATGNARDRPSLSPIVDLATGRVEMGVTKDSKVCLFFPYESCGWLCEVREGEIFMSIEASEDGHVTWLEFYQVIQRNGAPSTIGGSNHCRSRTAGSSIGLKAEMDRGAMASLKLE
jgi:hypothetical protein